MDAIKLRKKLVSLWNPKHIREKDFDVHICDMNWYSKAVAGAFLSWKSRDETWETYLKSNPLNGPKPERLLVISPDSDCLGTYLHTAVHEFAHCVRNSLSPLYPYPAPEAANMDQVIETLALKLGGQSKTATRFAKAIRGWERRRQSQCDEVLGQMKRAIFPVQRKGSKKNPPLFGGYALSENQYDASHDPLFYLIFYLLDRKAHDIRFYENKSLPKLSKTF